MTANVFSLRVRSTAHVQEVLGKTETLIEQRAKQFSSCVNVTKGAIK